MLAPTSLESTYPATKMKTLHFSPVSASSPSFALISVLALVSLAALTATAFLASARLERQATMPLTQTTILEMALNAGVNAAKEMLDYAPSKHFNFVTTYWRGAGTNDWTNELGYLLSGAVRSESIRTSTIVNYYCCFSTATMTNLGTTASATIVVSNDITNQGTFRSQMTTFMNTQTNFTSGQSTNIPLLGDTPTNRCTSPPVGWVYIKQDVRVKPGSTNTTNVPVTRFAFFVQDLRGMIDAERMGGLTNNTPYRESTALPTNYTQGTNPAEISLENLTGTALTNPTNVANFTSTSNRIKYLSPGMLILTNGGKLNTNDLRYVTTGLLHWTNAYERIPVGLGYAHSWSNKCNLSINSNLTLVKITNVIGKNLTFFTNRAGGMDKTNYLLNIAANIIDYVDTDSDPTYIAPDVRGSEAVAWPNEIIYQVTFSNTDTLLTNGGFQYAFKFKQYIETWNIHNTNVPTRSLSISNNLEILVRIPGTGGSAFSLASLTTEDQKTQIATNVASSPATLRPGEFGMLETPEQTFIYFADGATNATNVIIEDSINDNVLIKGTNSSSGPLTQTLGGMAIYGETNLAANLYSSRFLRANQFAYAISDPVLVTLTPRPAPLTVGGDPRAAFFLKSWPVKCSPFVQYASPGGLNWEYGNRSFSNSFVNAKSLWADGGRYISNDLGTYPTSSNISPANLYASRVGTWSTNLSLAQINNSGSLSNVCELGNIFDPIQWADTNQLPAAAGGQRGLWTNLTTTATNDSRFCGRSSLRIGRPEYSLFAWTNLAGATVATPNMMMSSAPLLDLFSSADQFDESGQINLNTASAPVLRALAGGIYLRSDPKLTGVGGSGASFAVPATMTEAFAQGVMRFRAQYPFYSPSQLSFIGTDPSWPNTNNWPNNAVFGNTNTIALAPNAPGNTFGSSARINVTAWNDQAAEEWFSKIFKLSTTYSRNFRVYVIAQKATTNSSGAFIGVGPVARKYYNVCTRQNKDKAPGTEDPPASASTFNTFESSY